MQSPTPKPQPKTTPKVAKVKANGKQNGNGHKNGNGSTIPTVDLKSVLVTGSGEAQVLLRKIKTREAKVGIIGLGYVGLPLMRLFASKGFTVLGYDLDQRKIASIRKGESYIGGVSSKDLKEFVKSGRVSATSDGEKLGTCDAIIICVPTPLASDGRPDVSYIKNSALAIAPRLRKGMLVVLESTSYPGTTREIVKPELEKKGMRAGVDFFLAFSPEREDPGNKQFNNEIIPKVVGGFDQQSGDVAAALYGEAVRQVVRVGTCEIAEGAKLLENIYRCVNIALVNELKMCFDKMGIDVWEVIRAASSKPFGFQPFQPGPGLGGHCIPIDPFYLSWKAREYQFATRFIDLAGELNIQMPYYVISKLEESLKARGRSLAGAQILMLGLSYKKDIDDPRESPSFKLLELLEQKGAKVVYNDPHVPEFPHLHGYEHLKVQSVALTEFELQSKDAVLIATDHSAFDFPWIAKNAPLVIDTRNACKEVANRSNIVRA